MTVEVLESAMRHLVDGSRFYDKQAPGLGDDFLAALFAGIDSLAFYGGIHTKRYGFHHSVSKRFPFAIYYLLNGDEVKVHAVLDSRRDPNWIRRQLRRN